MQVSSRSSDKLFWLIVVQLISPRHQVTQSHSQKTGPRSPVLRKAQRPLDIS